MISQRMDSRMVEIGIGRREGEEGRRREPITSVEAESFDLLRDQKKSVSIYQLSRRFTIKLKRKGKYSP